MESRIETLLNALISGETITGFRPRSRAEAYLLAAVNKSGTEGLPNPQSRLDALLCRLADDYEIDRAVDFGIVAENSGVGCVNTTHVHSKEHNVDVRLTSDTVTDFSGITVKRVGKNLFNIDNYTEVTKNNETVIGFDISNLVIGESYVFSSNLPITWFKISTHKSGTASVQHDNSSGFTSYTFKMSRNSAIPETSTQYLILAIKSLNAIKDISDLDGYEIQIEKGSKRTEYAPYIETAFTANADGTVDGITSISPVMNIVANVENITVHSKCYRDPNAGYKDCEAVFSDFLGDKISTFRVPDGTTHLRQYALSGGYTISTIYIPDSVYNLANNVAYNAYNLVKVVFEGGKITTLGTNTFANCSKLKTIEFGCELAFNMQTTMFSGCTALETVTFAQEKISKSVYIHQASKLTKQCVYNIIRKLKNYIGTDEEGTYYCKLHATVWPNVDDTTAEDYETPPSGDTWQNYVISLGWNV